MQDRTEITLNESKLNVHSEHLAKNSKKNSQFGLYFVDGISILIWHYFQGGKKRQFIPSEMSEKEINNPPCGKI
jgi:hypothetical protein